MRLSNIEGWGVVQNFFDGRELGWVGGGSSFFWILGCEIRIFLDYKQTNYLSGVRVVSL